MEHAHNSVTKSARQEDIIRVSKNVKAMMLRGELESGSVAQKTAEILGISKKTVYRYWNRKPDEIETPGKTRARKCIEAVGAVESFTRALIRRTIYGMVGRGEHLTLDTMLETVRETGDPGFQGSRSALYKLLKEEGFTWCKTDGRRVLLEDDRISAKRIDFLRSYHKLKEEGWMFVFLDETWFFSKGLSPKTWQDGTGFTCKRKNLDVGKRFIVLNAGNENGFVEGAGVVFAPGNSSGDYHGTINGEKFEKWMAEQLLPKLEEPSVIVMDNASYHSVQVEKLPTSSWKKADLCSWLAKENVAHNTSDTKQQLYQLTKQYRPLRQNKVDKLIYDAGHFVLRLPPYHCQYNPIELVWSDCKRWFYNHTGKSNRFDDEAVQDTWCQALAQVTPEKWKSYVSHTEKLMKQDSGTHERIDRRMTVQPVVIELGNSSDEEDDDTSEPLAVPLEQESYFASH